MQFKMLILLFLTCCLGCNSKERSGKAGDGAVVEMKFDKTRWGMKEGVHYPYRDGMLRDLVYNVPLKGLKKDELIDLLGEPTRVENGHLYYRVTQKRIGFFPLHTKTLVIKLAEDGTVEWRKIHE